MFSQCSSSDAGSAGSSSRAGLFSYLFAWRGASGLGSASDTPQVLEHALLRSDRASLLGRVVLITGACSTTPDTPLHPAQCPDPLCAA